MDTEACATKLSRDYAALLDFELICFDIVSEPSTPDAYMYPDKPKTIAKLSMYEQKINEKKDIIIDDLFNKILRD